jgi:hypothetical protein
LNYSSNNMQCGVVQATQLQAEDTAAVAPGPVPAPFGSSSAGHIGVFRAGSVHQQQVEQALCAAGAAAPAGFLQVPASISDAELDAIIAEELQAAGLLICSKLATGRPNVVLVGAACFEAAAAEAACFQPTTMHLIAAAPVPPLAPAAAPGVVAPTPSPAIFVDQAAQYAKLHALMAEYDELSTTLQQLQQAHGWGQQVLSDLARY